MTETLTHDQESALAEILAAMQPGTQYLLTGSAGTGKTTLMWRLTRALLDRSLSVALTAPTHKAVAVLARKLRLAGIEGVDSRTVQSLLSLVPKPHGDRMVFTRKRHAPPVAQDVVVIDECSMVDEALLGHIRRHLPVSFVVFVGDPAQLPPVGEVESKTFATRRRSHLSTIVRQGADNPVLAAAHVIRGSQGGDLDMSWCRSANVPPYGVFLPADSDAWMQKAFTSPEFEADPDTFRYLAWTNARVDDVNRRVRRWRYGDSAAKAQPFVNGEVALVRAPIIQDGSIIFNTNEESVVLDIQGGAIYEHPFHGVGDLQAWSSAVPSWRITMRRQDGDEAVVHMPANDRAYNQTISRITDEAATDAVRWAHLQEFKQSMAKLQSIYAMTVHTSQGSTFRNAFVDVRDIQRRASSNVLETQQLFYVAATRPTHALILV